MPRPLGGVRIQYVEPVSDLLVCKQCAGDMSFKKLCAFVARSGKLRRFMLTRRDKEIDRYNCM